MVKILYVSGFDSAYDSKKMNLIDSSFGIIEVKEINFLND
tara:strand:+ start:427 stop:546 length:120 start_codon:yes stop_codon:yes gene_type:complete